MKVILLIECLLISSKCLQSFLSSHNLFTEDIYGIYSIDNVQQSPMNKNLSSSSPFSKNSYQINFSIQTAFDRILLFSAEINLLDEIKISLMF